MNNTNGIIDQESGEILLRAHSVLIKILGFVSGPENYADLIANFTMQTNQ
jgi:hypothetical protein